MGAGKARVGGMGELANTFMLLLPCFLRTYVVGTKYEGGVCLVSYTHLTSSSPLDARIRMYLYAYMYAL
jgi:hypothetical protein